MKLGLGTVQFGLAYGATNSAGQVCKTEVRAILETARKGGIDLLDTAAAYGNSEEVLGSVGTGGFALISKTAPLPPNAIPKEAGASVRASVLGSLMRLGRERLDGILVHHADNLLADGGEIVFEALLKLKDEGRVGRIGCSVYTGYEIEALLARYSLEILQVPINVLDQRLLLSGLLADIKARGIEIHARSLFLQGILLAPPDTLSARFGPLMPALRRFSEACTRAGASPLAACLAFARRCGFLDYGMVGVISRQQLQDILSAWGVSGSLMLEFGELASPEHAMLNPAHWPAV